METTPRKSFSILAAATPDGVDGGDALAQQIS